jgi:hypothetical protein
VTRSFAYIAHQLSAATDDAMQLNRANGARWCAWLAKHCDVVPLAPWIYLSMAWTEAEGRELGLELDKDTILRCDTIILVGPRVSSGMEIEVAFAKRIGVKVIDLTGYGCPTAPVDDAPELVALVRTELEA